jgi:hypothetical protein
MQRERQSQEAAREQQALDAHNRAFLGTLKREAPDYFSMITNPTRQAEAKRYFQEVYGWIASKPYAEAAPLMEIARAGCDAVKVADLIKRFESERKARPAASQPDPTAALAVPSKGLHIAPSGIGDKDSFDAGFELSTTSKE